MLVVHHNDADGRCAAAIVFKWFNTCVSNKGMDIRFIEMDYNKELPLAQVNQNEQVYIVDFSLKPKVMDVLLKITENVHWCDHHKTAKDYKYSVAVRGYQDFSEKGLCGAECTWKYCFLSDIPNSVQLLGDYDSWRLEQVPYTFQFYEGLKLRNQDPKGSLWAALLSPGGDTVVEAIRAEGQAAIMYRDNYCKDMLESYAYETKIEGHDALAANIYRFGSQGFGPHFETYPICISYVHDGRKFVVSLYSKAMVDVSVIAKKFGGGGHTLAAGFVCDKLPFVPRPKEVANGKDRGSG